MWVWHFPAHPHDVRQTRGKAGRSRPGPRRGQVRRIGHGGPSAWATSCQVGRRGETAHPTEEACSRIGRAVGGRLTLGSRRARAGNGRNSGAERAFSPHATPTGERHGNPQVGEPSRARRACPMRRLCRSFTVTVGPEGSQFGLPWCPGMGPIVPDVKFFLGAMQEHGQIVANARVTGLLVAPPGSKPHAVRRIQTRWLRTRATQLVICWYDEEGCGGGAPAHVGCQHGLLVRRRPPT